MGRPSLLVPKRMDSAGSPVTLNGTVAPMTWKASTVSPLMTNSVPPCRCAGMGSTGHSSASNRLKYSAASEHAAEFLVPIVVSTLTTMFPRLDIQLRLTRSERVRQLVDDSRADIALMLERATPSSVTVAPLPLQWFGTDEASRHQIVLFARPCAVRDQALSALTGRRHSIVKEGADLTCVLTAAREGVGVTPLPRMGPPPEGLRHVRELPPIPSVALNMASSERIDRRARAAVLGAMRQALDRGTG